MYPQVFDIVKFAPPSMQKVVANNATKHPRASKESRLMLAYLILAIAGGALRKWIFTDGVMGNIIFFILLVYPFVFLIFGSPKAQMPYARFRVLVLFFAYLLFQVFNPYQKTLFHGMIGFLIYAGFWVGIFFYITNRHLFNLTVMIPVCLVIAALEVILGFVQYALPQDHILNRYAIESANENIATIGDAVRITGTFSYLAGLNAYLFFHAFLGWALIRLRYPKWLFSAVFVSGFILCFMSGSRSGTFLYLGFMGLIFFQEFPFRMLSGLLFKILIPVIVAIIVLLQLLPNNQVVQRSQKAFTNFWDRTSSLYERGEQSKRYFTNFDKLNNSNYIQSPLIGIGTAATYQGAIILFGKAEAVSRFGYVESEFVQSILEGGILLLLIRLILVITLVLQLPFSKLMKWYLVICIMYALPIIFNVYNAAFLLMGIALIDSIMYHQKRQYTIAKHNV